MRNPLINTIYSLSKTKWLLCLVFSLSVFFICSPKASADIGPLFPNDTHANIGWNIYAISSKSGNWCPDIGSPDHSDCQTGLDAQSTYFKLFRTDGNTNATTAGLLAACAYPAGLNDKGNSNLRVELRHTTASGSPGGVVKVAKLSDPAGSFTRDYITNFGPSSGCDGVGNLGIRIPGTAFNNLQSDRYPGSSTLLLHVIKDTSGSYAGKGQKYFRVAFTGGQVSFDDLGARPGGQTYNNQPPGFGAFAVNDGRSGAGNAPEGTWYFKFRPDCSSNPNQDAFLKWSDADYGEPNEQIGDIGWTLLGPGGGTIDHQEDGGVGGQGANFPNPNAENVGKLHRNTVYTWRWEGVDRTNGVQLWMPFSEYNQYPNCSPPTEPTITGVCNLIQFRMGSGGTLPNGQPGPSNRRYAVWVNDDGSSNAGGDPDRGYTTGQKYSPPQINGSDYNGIAASISGPGEHVNLSLLNDNKIVTGNLHYTVVVYSVYTVLAGSHAGEHWNHVWKRTTDDVGPCYKASCTLNIHENVPGNTDPNSGAVQSGQNFTATVTMHNDGINTLPVNVNSNYLSATSYFSWLSPTGPYPYFRNDHTPPDETKAIAPGGTGTMDLTFTAPGNVSANSVTMHPDYWGKFWIDSGVGCSAPVNTYQPYNLNLTAPLPVLSPSDEDPNKVHFEASVGGPGSNIPAGTDIRVQYNAQSTRNGAIINSASNPSSPLAINYVFETDPRPVSAGDNFCVSIHTDQANGWAGPPGTPLLGTHPASLGPSCSHIFDRPYVSVYGADVMSGSGFKDGETCNAIAGGGQIKTFRSGVAGKSGSGAQFAAMALGQITGFASARLYNPSMGLTFANTAAGTGTVPDQPADGGMFGDHDLCATDFWGNKKSPETVSGNPLDIKFIHDGKENQITAGPAGLNLTNSGYAKNATLYVDGDVIIKNNIDYPLGKNFKLIVRGDIYIDKDITKLDGLYVAQSNGASGGNIYTCAIGKTPCNSNAATFYNNSRKQLVVNGAFVAKSVKLLRTYSSLRNSTAGEVPDGEGGGTNAAEVFNFSPEIYLYSSGGDSNSGESQDPHDYITTLPSPL